MENATSGYTNTDSQKLSIHRRTGSDVKVGCCGLSNDTWTGLYLGVVWLCYVLFGSLVFTLMEDVEQVIEHWSDRQAWGRFKEVVVGGVEVEEEVKNLTAVLLDLCNSSTINNTFGQLSSNTDGRKDDENWTILQRAGITGDAKAWLESVERECGESLQTSQNITITQPWSMVDSLYYTMASVTTIGYGNVPLGNPASRVFFVLFCMLGVPLTCLLMVKSTDAQAKQMADIVTIAKNRYPKHPQLVLYGMTSGYLFTGFIVFMFLPSILISWLEDWTYNMTLYMTFDTLTTIGTGDFYPGYREDRPYSQPPYCDIYKVAITIWVMAAIGYWFLLLNILEKVMRKDVPRRIKRLRTSIRLAKHTTAFKQRVFKKSYEDPEACPGEGREVKDSLATQNTCRVHDNECELSDLSSHLSQLLDITITLGPDTLPALHAAITHTPKDHQINTALTTMSYNLTEDHKEQQNEQKEQQQKEDVVLALRDVYNLVTFLKSMQKE